MTAINKPIYFEQGATFIWAFQWCYVTTDIDGNIVLDAAGNPVPGTPRDLTGWQMRMQVRKTQLSTPLLDGSTLNGKIVLGRDPNNLAGPDDPTNGWVWVEFSDEDTDLITSATAKYDLEAENPEGQVFRLWQGTATTDPNITQEGGTEPGVGP